MNEKFFSAIDYAIEEGDVALMDMLVGDFNKLGEIEKNEVLRGSIEKSKNTDFIQHVLDYGYPLDYVDKDNNTMLHFAASSPNPETVQFFIDKGLDLEAKDSYGNTPLKMASILSTNPLVLQTLMDAGADVTTTSNGGETILITASGHNDNPEVIKFLLKAGCDIEERDNEGFTPLLNAALWQDDLEILKVLIDAGANVYAEDKNGNNLLHLAVRNPNFCIANFVYTAFSASLQNRAGETCFETALLYGREPEVIKIMLRKLKAEHIMYACSNECIDILETLIQSGYDANTIDTDGVSALMMAAKYNKSPDIIKMLCFYGASREMHDDVGHNVLHYAAVNPDPAIYSWMLEQEEFKDLTGETDSQGNLPEYYRSNPDKF